MGRSTEQSILRGLIRERRPVTVLGPAGIGKTTLVTRSVGSGAMVGGGLPALSASPFFALDTACRTSLAGDTDAVAQQVLDIVGSRVLVIEDLHWTHDSTTAVLQLLSGRIPIVVTGRPAELSPAQRQFADTTRVLALPPLDPESAHRLVRTTHPDLTAEGIDATIELAGGNPLLLEMLPSDDGTVATDISDALAAILDTLEPCALDALGRLSLLGRPADSTIVGENLPGVLVTTTEAGLWFRHPLFAEVVAQMIDGSAPRLHAELADRLPDDEAAIHHLAAGNPPEALRTAMAAADAADHAIGRARQLAVAVEAETRLGRCSSRTRVRAAEALVGAQLFDEAIRVADGVAAADPALRAEALFHRGRARWFAGDPDAAARDLEEAAAVAVRSHSGLRARIHGELAYLRLRHSLGGGLGHAQQAMVHAERSGVGLLRARALVGVALGYQLAPGWESVLREVAADARAGEDREVEMITAFHLTSALGLTGRLADANTVSRAAARRAEECGLTTWQSHFDCSLLMNLALMGREQQWVVDHATTVLTERARFRNWAQAATARCMALSDLGRMADARAAVEELLREAENGEAEDVTWACVAAGAVAWIDGDRALVSDCRQRSEALGDSYYGLRVTVELDALHLSLDDGLATTPSVPAVCLPLLWPAHVELEAFALLDAGDASAAADRFSAAAAAWQAHEIPRFEARALVARSHALMRAGRRGGDTARREALAVARVHGLAAHLDRWGSSAFEELTARETLVLREVAHGRSTMEIAARLDLAPATVDAYISSARRKLGVATRAEAALLVTGGR